MMKLQEIISKVRVWGMAGIRNYAFQKLNDFCQARRLRALALKSTTTPTRGITVIADLTGQVSLSKTMRDFVLSLKEAGIPVQTYDTTRRCAIPKCDAANVVTPVSEFDIKKYDHIVLMYRAPIDKALLPGIKIARIAFHESEHGIEVTAPFLRESGDEIIAMSEFNYEYFKKAFPEQKVHYIVYPLRLPTTNYELRTTNGGKKFTVFFNFDFGSYYRKNVGAALEAFKAAFGDKENTRLVFKTKGAKANPRQVAEMMAKVKELGLENRFEHIANYISREALDKLAAETDVYLSLHHAEGFGLGMAEAMAAKVPVVATDWSANTEFCNVANSWPTPVKMTPILPHEYMVAMKEWAAPDVQSAARALREIYDNPQTAARKAELAQAQLRERYSLANFKSSVEKFLEGGASGGASPVGSRKVTVLAYHFWEEEGYAEAFAKVAHAFEETWKHCGELKSVIVVNQAADCVREFAARHSNVEVQVEPSLVPGKIETMSADCNSKLYSRFTTPYVLIIQADGYPLRPGLEEFVGKYDFIGAPYIRNVWWKNLIAGILGMWCSNGGFSLRSKRICEAAARAWASKWQYKHPCQKTVEDLFYTQTLPLTSLAYRFKFKLANNREALRFSYDPIVEHHPQVPPFGFHREKPRTKKYELAIAHRVCPALAKTAYKYTDKLAMVRDTNASLASSLCGIRTKLLVILDGCDAEYEKLFDETFAGGKVEGVDYERISTPKIGNHPTYKKQLEWLEGEVGEAENLYFSEDDYIYDRAAFRKMMDCLREPGVDFVSPLDHPDAYRREAFGYPSKVREMAGGKWKTTGSTCCTFMLRSDGFAAKKSALAWYAEGGADYEMWTLVTKDGVFSPKLVIGGILRHIFHRDENSWMLAIPVICWLKLRTRLFSKRFKLWTPLPTLAVHLCVPSLPPNYERLMV